MTRHFAAVALVSTAVQGLAFDGKPPQPTDDNLLPATPAWNIKAPTITTPPNVKELAKRQNAQTVLVGPDNTCGYIDGRAGAALTCPTGNTCAFLTGSDASAYGAVGCCDNDDCGLRVQCYDYADVYQSSLCDDGCLQDTFTVKCTGTAAPYCATATWFDGIVDYYCDDLAISTLRQAYTTYDGEDDGRSFEAVVVTVTTNGGGGEGGSIADPSAAAASSSSTSVRTTSTRSPALITPLPPGGSSSSSSSSSSSPPIGPIVGGAVGGVAVLALVIFFLFFVLRRRRSSSSKSEKQQQIPGSSSSNTYPPQQQPQQKQQTPFEHSPSSPPMVGAPPYQQHPSSSYFPVSSSSPPSSSPPSAYAANSGGTWAGVGLGADQKHEFQQQQQHHQQQPGGFVPLNGVGGGNGGNGNGNGIIGMGPEDRTSSASPVSSTTAWMTTQHQHQATSPVSTIHTPSWVGSGGVGGVVGQGGGGMVVVHEAGGDMVGDKGPNANHRGEFHELG